MSESVSVFPICDFGVPGGTWYRQHSAGAILDIQYRNAHANTVVRRGGTILAAYVKMSEFEGIIGLDLGTHLSSIAIWNFEKDSIDVIADDTGSRVIPTSVAFRGDEILTG